jgi:hypothetical protein
MSFKRSVVRLTDERVDRADGVVARLRQRPPHRGLERRADRERVGQDDRRFDGSQFLHLSRSGELAKCVADEHRAGDLLAEQIAAVRQDRRHPGPDGVAGHDRRLTDADALDVGDRIERSRLHRAWRDPEIARART